MAEVVDVAAGGAGLGDRGRDSPRRAKRAQTASWRSQPRTPGTDAQVRAPRGRRAPRRGPRRSASGGLADAEGAGAVREQPARGGRGRPPGTRPRAGRGPGCPTSAASPPPPPGARMFPRGCSRPRLAKHPRHLGPQAGHGQPLALQPQLAASAATATRPPAAGPRRASPRRSPRRPRGSPPARPAPCACARRRPARCRAPRSSPRRPAARRPPGSPRRGRGRPARPGPGASPQSSSAFPTTRGEEGRRLGHSLGQAGDVEIFGGEEGEAGRRRLLPLHGGQEAEARLAPRGGAPAGTPPDGRGRAGRARGPCPAPTARGRAGPRSPAPPARPRARRDGPSSSAVYRLRSMNFSKADLGAAPIMRSAILPSLNRMKVGMLETWNW